MVISIVWHTRVNFLKCNWLLVFYKDRFMQRTVITFWHIIFIKMQTVPISLPLDIVKRLYIIDSSEILPSTYCCFVLGVPYLCRLVGWWSQSRHRRLCVTFTVRTSSLTCFCILQKKKKKKMHNNFNILRTLSLVL